MHLFALRIERLEPSADGYAAVGGELQIFRDGSAVRSQGGERASKQQKAERKKQKITYFFHGISSGKEVISYSAGFRGKYVKTVGKAAKKCLQNRTGYGNLLWRVLWARHIKAVRCRIA